MLSHGPRVLVVHDDRGFRARVRALLEDARCEVVAEAVSAREAIGLIGTAMADVILLPWRLPDMSGTELLTAVRAAASGERIVVFSSQLDGGALAALIAAVHRLHGGDDPSAWEAPERDGAAREAPPEHTSQGNGARRVLVVDHDPSARDPIRRAIERDGGTVSEAESVAEAEALLDGQFDGVIVDSRLPDGDAIDLARTVARKTPTAQLVVWNDVDDHAPAWVAHVPKADMETAVGVLGLGGAASAVGHALDRPLADLIRQWKEGCRLARLPTPASVVQHLSDALETARQGGHRAMVDDVVRDVTAMTSETVPVEAAVEALYRLRDTLVSHLDTRGPACAVVAVVTRANRLIDNAVAALSHHEFTRLRREAETDVLTGLSNRRAFQRTLEIEGARALRYRRPFSVVVADLDGLKQINDRDGHLAGDRTLQAFAATLRRSLRASDAAFRIGGDEFVLLMPETAADDLGDAVARVVAARGPSFSWGAATFPDNTNQPSQLLALADRQLIERRRRHRR